MLTVNPFVPDALENNDIQSESTIIGSPPTATYNDLTTHNDSDVDWLKYTAHDTGLLNVNLFNTFKQNVDVFFLIDDSGSFIGLGNDLEGIFDNLISFLETNFPATNFAFGVGRLEDYANFEGSNSTSRPFILQQPILETSDAQFNSAMNAAFGRTPPGNGGDTEETVIEALYQVATGFGFDGNNDGDTTDSGPAGPVNTQQNPGGSGDVPAFSTFTPDGGGPVVAPSGTLGGVGWRPEAMKLLIVATDNGFRFEPDGFAEYVGLGGVVVPASEVTNDGEGDTPDGRGASIQQTVDALNELGIQVIGIGDNNNPNNAPKGPLQALATLTGALNNSGAALNSGTPGDPIQPGEPLYFNFDSGDPTNLFQSIVNAISAANTPLELEIVDHFGNVLAVGSSTVPTLGLLELSTTIPVVSQEEYFIRVNSEDGYSTIYDLEIENFPAPIPPGVVMDPASDSGRSNADNVTNDTTPTFIINADLSEFADAGIAILTAAQLDVLIPPPGVGVAWVITELDGSVLETGFADLVPGTLFSQFAFTPVDPLPDGDYLVRARVVVVDQQEDPIGGPDPASGDTLLGPETLFTIDMVDPTWSNVEIQNVVLDGGDFYTNINEIVLEGTATANSIVRIYIDSDLWGEALVGDDESDEIPGNGFGRFLVTLSPIEDGTYQMTMQFEDVAGNLDDPTDIFHDTIVDTLAPQRPTLDLVAADDTGMMDDDDITRLRVLDFRISAEAGSDVVIKDGDTVILTIPNIVLDPDGFATITIDFDVVETNFGIPAEGPHPLSIESTDTAGNRSAQSAVLPLVIDDTAPNGISATLFNASSFPSTNIIELAFAGSAEAGSKIRAYANGTLFGETVTGSNESNGALGDGWGVWEITAEPLPDGTYDISFQVEDAAGNIFISSSDFFDDISIDTLPPQRPTLDLVAEGDTGMMDDDDITRLRVLDFRISAEAGTDVVVKDGDTVILTIPNIVLDPDGFATITIDFDVVETNFGIPAEGPHPLSIESTDDATNRSAQSAVLPLVIDDTIPTFSSVTLFNASNFPFTNINEIAFRGVAEANVKVRVYANGGLIGEGVVGSDESLPPGDDDDGIWEITAEPLPDGQYTFEVQYEDAAGNVSVFDNLFPDFTVDTLPPQRPTIDLLMSDDTGSFEDDDITNIDPPVLEFRISAEPGSTVHIKDGETIIETLPNFTPGPDGFLLVTIDFDQVETMFNIPAEGPHPLSVESFDEAGNRSAQSVELQLVIDLTPPILGDPPIFILSSSVTDVCLDDDIIQTSVTQPAFSGLVEALAIVRIYALDLDDPMAEPELIGVGQAGSDESDGVPGDNLGIWEITVEPLADGNYSILMQVEDIAGNITPFEPEPGLIIEIDTLAPQRPTIDLVDSFDTGSSDLDNVTNLAVLDFRISAEPGSHVVVKDGEVVIVDIPNFVPGPDGFLIITIDFNQVEVMFNISANGPHPLSVEAFDCAGNRSHQSEELLVTIDLINPPASQPDLLSSSDSGMFDDDNVTNIRTPAFTGFGEANAIIRIYAAPVVNGIPGAPELVGIGLVGSDESDENPTDGLGIWEVTIEPLDDGEYEISTVIEDLAGNLTVCGFVEHIPWDGGEVGPAGEGGWEGEWNGEWMYCDGECEPITVYIDTLVPNTPYLDLEAASDTGRHNADEITRDVTPTFTVTASDLPGNISINPLAIVNPFWHDIKWRLFARKGDSPEVLVASINTLSELGHFIETIDMPSFYGMNPGDVDGVYSFKLEVEDRAGNISPDFLLTVTFDTIAPIPSGDLHPNSDSGVTGYTPTFGDKITNVKTPSFFGSAEANAFVDLMIDGVPAGGTVAVPLDGNFAFLLNGEFYALSNLNLQDGLHVAKFTHEDVAGNMASFERQFFVDTQGPRIINVTRGEVSFDGVLSFDGETSLFAPKPQSAVDPLLHSIVVYFLDQPPRVQQFLYEAVFAALASQPGNYSLVGDHTGFVTIVAAIPQFTTIAGLPALASVELVFAEPLEDDRFTLMVSDNLRDPAGNALDGESSAAGPFAGNPFPQDTPPFFPTGDGSPGGKFTSRFTADSRPEIGTYASTTVYLDINGNGLWDPTGVNNDRVNRDLVFIFGNHEGTNDSRFAGKFSPFNVGAPGKAPTDGFDKLGAYGNFGGTFRWLIDTDSDGVPNLTLVDAFQKDAIPVAGNFDLNKANGDEIGYFTGDTWYLDTNGDYVLDTVISSALRGYPIVGDFDGDGFDDLATYAADRFQFDFFSAGGWNGAIEDTIFWGFDGVVERPVAADMDADGIDDIGLWVPGRSGQLPQPQAEWYFLLSDREIIRDEYENGNGGGEGAAAAAFALYGGDQYEYPNGEFGVAPPPAGNADWLDHPFSPVPFGNDLHFGFGDQFAIPILGNFDPPNDPLTDNFAFLPFEDNFDRADSNSLGSKWTERAGNVMISGGQMVQQTSSNGVATLNGVTQADVLVEGLIDVNAGGSIGLLARYGGPGDSNAYMGLLVNTGSGFAAQIWRNVGGTWTNLTSQAVGGGAGTLAFEVIGTSLRLTLDGHLVGETTDSQISTGGSVGVRHSGGKLDSFKAQTQFVPLRTAADLPYSDNFDRPSGTALGSMWRENEGDLGVSSGKAVLYRNATSIATLNDVAAADVVVSADLDATEGGNTGLVARWSGDGDLTSSGYMARIFRGTSFYAAQIWRAVDGAYVPLRSVPISGGAGNLKLEVIGTQLKLYFNGELVASTTDSTITGAGTVGLRHAGGTIDNFSAARAEAPAAQNAVLPFVDAFTKPNGSLLAAEWATQAGDFRITNGQVVLGANETSIAVLNGASQANVSVRADVDITGGGNIGLLARYSGPGDANGYMGRLIESAGRYYAQIWRNIGGEWSYLTHAEVSGSVGTLRFDVVGSSLKLYFNDVLAGDTTDSSITGAGTVGFRHSGGSLDNFRAE